MMRSNWPHGNVPIATSGHFLGRKNNSTPSGIIRNWDRRRYDSYNLQNNVTMETDSCSSSSTTFTDSDNSEKYRFDGMRINNHVHNQEITHFGVSKKTFLTNNQEDTFTNDTTCQSEEPSPTENSKKKKNPKKSKSKPLTIQDLGKVDMLRQDLLEYSFNKAGLAITPGEVLELKTQVSEHGEAKIIRNNQICPKHMLAEHINKKYGLRKNIVPLCIDRCEHCPSVVHRMCENKNDWYYVEPLDDGLKTISEQLKQYISLYSKKPTQGKMYDVVKYPALQLDISIIDNYSNKLRINQRHKLQIMKKDYFNKIRTSTPKLPAQPLNLTYPKFWMEVVKDNVYLCVVDKTAWKRYENKVSRRTITSAIGAYVDGKMEVELAMMSCFQNTQIKFEWVVRKEYVATYHPRGIVLGLSLTGNKESPDLYWTCPLTAQDMTPFSSVTYNQGSPQDDYLKVSRVPPSLPPRGFQIQNTYQNNWNANDDMHSSVDYSPFLPPTPPSYPMGCLMEEAAFVQQYTRENFNRVVHDDMKMEIEDRIASEKRGKKRRRKEMETELPMEHGTEYGMGPSIMGFSYDTNGQYLPNLYGGSGVSFDYTYY